MRDIVHYIKKYLSHSYISLLQYYGHRAKLRLIGREDELEALNIQALKVAREVADETGTLMAGNLCNSTTYRKDDPKSIEECRQMNKVDKI